MKLFNIDLVVLNILDKLLNFKKNLKNMNSHVNLMNLRFYVDFQTLKFYKLKNQIIILKLYKFL